jgi:hypothetical protein
MNSHTLFIIMAGRGVWAGDTKPGTTSPASLRGLPLLGGRAFGFSRGPRTIVGLDGPLVWLLLPIPSLLGIGGAGMRRRLGAVRSGLIRLEFGCLQSLLNASVVAKEMGE